MQQLYYVRPSLKQGDAPCWSHVGMFVGLVSPTVNRLTTKLVVESYVNADPLHYINYVS